MSEEEERAAIWARTYELDQLAGASTEGYAYDSDDHEWLAEREHDLREEHEMEDVEIRRLERQQEDELVAREEQRIDEQLLAQTRGDAEHTCPECGRSFGSRQGLGRHRTTTHRKQLKAKRPVAEQAAVPGKADRAEAFRRYEAAIKELAEARDALKKLIG